ncbi:TDP-4-oxo-6-deoxy-D-glucose aminotransferase [Mycobacterium tuberculosis variant africanum]|nr:TDP-4-oxo-6-deoxy-D-glucose aminotransferase [Mycobacterium tuberculosis variant africanum]
MYYVLLAPSADREEVLARLTSKGIGAVFHYVPLHDSPAGRRYGRTNGNLTVTNDVASRLIRLPMWVGLQEVDQSRVVEALTRILTLRA